jgi:hypothetical protein
MSRGDGPAPRPANGPQSTGATVGGSASAMQGASALPVAGGGPGAPPAAGAFANTLSSFLARALRTNRSCLQDGSCEVLAAFPGLLLGAPGAHPTMALTPGTPAPGLRLVAPARGGVGSPPPMPVPVPVPVGGVGGVAGSGSGSGASLFFVVAGLLLLGGSWRTRRLRIFSGSWRPAPFVLVPERPG